MVVRCCVLRVVCVVGCCCLACVAVVCYLLLLIVASLVLRFAIAAVARVLPACSYVAARRRSLSSFVVVSC